jgi:hypothetical protein
MVRIPEGTLPRDVIGFEPPLALRECPLAPLLIVTRVRRNPRRATER